MQLQTTRFGVLDIDPDTVLTFTQPIIGFPEQRRYILLDGPEGSGLSWLQSTEQGDLAFLLMRPKDVIADYQVKLSQHELNELAAASQDDLLLFTLLVVPADKTKIRTNLKAPVLINRKHRLGKQTVLERTDYPIQFFLNAAAREPGGEVQNARADA
ncbi:MAG: hypothetical protein GC168_15875 [Candidatus Hydrogenedens sp.]|nr:hypothetical protein [Candidatus Hydrogenedens sp.]